MENVKIVLLIIEEIYKIKCVLFLIVKQENLAIYKQNVKLVQIITKKQVTQVAIRLNAKVNTEF